MIYLTGASNQHARAWAKEGGPIGLLVQPWGAHATQLPHYDVWAADNGCFNPKRFTIKAWWAWLSNLDPAGCLFATAPDVVGDWALTLVQSTPWFAPIKSLGFPVALVAQDGATVDTVPWGDIDALFIGGSDDWKLGADCCELMAAAKDRGKHVHVGRVNSWERLHRSHLAGADTADGTFLAFGPDKNIVRLRGWFDRVQPVLPFGRRTIVSVVLALILLTPTPALAHEGGRVAVVEHRGKKHAVTIPPLLRAIRGCESGSGPRSPGNYRALSKISSASGAYQILGRRHNKTWGSWSRAYGKDVGATRYPSAAAAPPWIQDVVATRAFARQGTRPWNASRHCWGKR